MKTTKMCGVGTALRRGKIFMLDKLKLRLGWDEMLPSIEAAAKMADILNVSLDYLVGKTDMELDNTMLKRIQLVSKLPAKEKECVYVFLDSFIDRMKLQGIL